MASSSMTNANKDEPEEHLYLLEVIVNSLEVYKEGILDTFMLNDSATEVNATEKQKGPARVLVKFYDFPTIEIQEKEFKDNETPVETGDVEGSKTSNVELKADSGKVPVYKTGSDTEKKTEKPQPDKYTTGKSCLFPLAPKGMIEVIKKFPVEICVYRDETMNEPAHLIGKAKVNLDQNFVDVVALANTTVVLPISAVVESEYGMTNVFSDVTGRINLLIRLTCFGGTIFTQFKYVQGQKEFKFSTGEVTKKTAKTLLPGEKDEADETKDERVPFFTDEDTLELPGGCAATDTFKRAVPWRKYHDHPVDVKICGPKRLFKESRGEEETQQCALANLGQMFPSVKQNQRNISYGGGMPPSTSKCPCLSNMDSSRTNQVPLEFGTCPPQAVRDSFPAQPGPGKGPLEIPPGTKFPCQFGAQWISECPTPTYVCTNPSNTERACCQGNCRYPPIEQSSNLKSANENRSAKGPNQVTINSKQAFLNSDLVSIPCPSLASQPQNQVRCGLGALVEPDYKNMSNLLQPTLFAPECPADSNQKRMSLCTCPKVPTLQPEPVRGGIVKCECSNILKALKPIDMPELCPKPGPSCPLTNSYMDCPPCPPVPINLPPPPPDCPLARLLQEARQDQSFPPVEDSRKLPPPSQAQHAPIDDNIMKHETESEAAKHHENKAPSAPTGPNSSSKPQTQHPITNVSAKTKDKAHKILQEEVAKHDKGGRSSEDAGSRAPSFDSRSSSQPQKSKKRPPRSGKEFTVSPPPVTTSAEKKREIKYTPTAGIYPGLVIGHKDCIPPVYLVPKRMGWLWNISNAEGYMRPGRGWRPGSIQTGVMKVIDHVKTKQVNNRRVVKNVRTGEMTRKADSHKTMAGAGGDAASLYHPPDMTPTFHIHKKSDGLMYFSLSPPKPTGKAKKPRRKKIDQKGQLVDASSSDESHPVIFTIDPKSPDGPDVNQDLYETESTSTNSQDSYVIDLTAPSTLRARQPRPICKDIAFQVTEEELITHNAAVVKVEKAGDAEGKNDATNKKKGKRSRMSRGGNPKPAKKKPSIKQN